MQCWSDVSHLSPLCEISSPVSQLVSVLFVSLLQLVVLVLCQHHLLLILREREGEEGGTESAWKVQLSGHRCPGSWSSPSAVLNSSDMYTAVSLQQTMLLYIVIHSLVSPAVLSC